MGNRFSSSARSVVSSKSAGTTSTKSSKMPRRSVKSHKLRKSKKSTSKQLPQQVEQAPPMICENPTYCALEPSGEPGEAKRIATKWVDAKNDFDLMKLLALASHDANFRFPAAGVVIPMRNFLDMMLSLRDAFPDLRFEYESISEHRDGEAVLTNYFALGTHTGTPYQFPPHEAIPPIGIKVINGPMRQTIKIRDGKVIDLECASPPDVLAGPLGFYEDTKAAWEDMKRNGKVVRKSRGS